jgi:hypothetical protein
LKDQLLQSPDLKTGYPTVDKLPSTKAKIRKLEQFKNNDALWLEAFSLIDKKGSGSYGRCGGHFCFNRNFSYFELADNIDRMEAGLAGDKQQLPRFPDALREFRQIERYHNTCKALCQEIEQMAPRMVSSA